MPPVTDTVSNSFGQFIAYLATRNPNFTGVPSTTVVGSPDGISPSGPPPIGAIPTVSSPVIQKVIAKAFTYLGMPYLYGGNGNGSIDCSALIQNSFAAAGITLPRTASTQVKVGIPVNFNSLNDIANLQPGDRFYFSYRTTCGHTGLYIGGGKMIHASSGAHKVVVVPLTQHHITHLYGVRRFP